MDRPYLEDGARKLGNSTTNLNLRPGLLFITGNVTPVPGSITTQRLGGRSHVRTYIRKAYVKPCGKINSQAFTFIGPPNRRGLNRNSRCQTF